RFLLRRGLLGFRLGLASGFLLGSLGFGGRFLGGSLGFGSSFLGSSLGFHSGFLGCGLGFLGGFTLLVAYLGAVVTLCGAQFLGFAGNQFRGGLLFATCQFDLVTGFFH